MDIYCKYFHLGWFAHESIWPVRIISSLGVMKSINSLVMIRTKVNIINDSGLHARPAVILVQKASSFDADFIIQKHQKRVNGKSILEILTLIAEQGDELILEWDGSDEEAAAKCITELFRNGFELA